jgi:peptide deformylase
MWKPSKPPFHVNKKKVFLKIPKVGSFIFHIGDSNILRNPSQEIEIKHVQSKEFQRKLQYLKSCFIRYRKITGKGKGIAGVQVGIHERLALIYMPERKDPYVFIINPKITKVSGEKLTYSEICMSADPLVAPVVRPAWVEVEYYDQNGKKKYWARKNRSVKDKIYNRVWQHEIDHMDGIINIDRVQSKDLSFALDTARYDQATFKTSK